MPDLYPELGRLRGPWALLDLFVDQGPLSDEMRAFRALIIRLTDKAIREYSLAKIELQNQINESKRPLDELMKGRIIYMFGFVDHLENCINAAHRIQMLSREIHRDPTAPHLDNRLRGRIGHLAGELKEIRHSLEHPEERIRDGRLGNDGPLAISLSDDAQGIALGPHILSFDALAEILRAAHELAEKLLNQPSPG